MGGKITDIDPRPRYIKPIPKYYTNEPWGSECKSPWSIERRKDSDKPIYVLTAEELGMNDKTTWIGKELKIPRPTIINSASIHIGDNCNITNSIIAATNDTNEVYVYKQNRWEEIHRRIDERNEAIEQLIKMIEDFGNELAQSNTSPKEQTPEERWMACIERSE